MTRVCVECGKTFVPLPKSKRVTCGRSCAVALAWKKDGDKRRASLSKSHLTPKEIERVRLHNERRWAKDGERERLSEWNRKRWATPSIKRKVSAAIRKSHRTPEFRAQASMIRLDLWRDPEYRNKAVDAIQRSHAAPEYRAKFSKALRERWKDPAWRAKVSAINAERVRLPEYRARAGELSRKRWAEDPVFRETVLTAIRFLNSQPEELARKSAVMKVVWADPVWRQRQLQIIGETNPRFKQRGARRDESLADTAGLLAMVENAIPKYLPEYARADITQDIFLAILEKQMVFADLKAGAKALLAKYNKLFPEKYGPLSLDAPVRDGSGTTFVDLLDSEAAHF